MAHPEKRSLHLWTFKHQPATRRLRHSGILALLLILSNPVAHPGFHNLFFCKIFAKNYMDQEERLIHVILYIRIALGTTGTHSDY